MAIDFAYRGKKEHAEFVLLEKKLKMRSLAGATVYTTLEPCTVRNEDKTPCVERLIQRRVARVVIGMLDPNPLVTGYGYWKLRKAGVRVTIVDEDDLMAQLEEVNRNFIRAIETKPIHNAAREILTLATRASTACQQRASVSVVTESVDSLRRIHRGEIRIPGREAGYLRRFLERLNETNAQEHVRAYIRLAAFDPHEVLGKSWFESFYQQLDQAVRDNNLRIEYIFLLRTAVPTGPSEEFLSRYKQFAETIGYVWQDDPRITPKDFRPSIVLFQTQRIAFTHDRGNEGVLLEATEWVSKEAYGRLRAQFDRIALMSTTWFRK
jgi:pyrimidine deaminase RibD-like protein